MINICYFIGSFQVGGAENLVHQIIRNLDKSRYNVFVATFEDIGDLRKEYEKLNVEITVFPQKRDKIKSAKRFREFLKNNKIDAIHIHLTGTFIFACTVAKLAGVSNIITHWHNVYYINKNLLSWWRILLARFEMKYSSIVSHSIIAISKKVKQTNCEIYNIGRNKVSVVYNSIDINNIPDLSHVSRDKNVMGCIGKVSEQKGYDTLIRGFKLIHDHNPDAKLEIVGLVDDSSYSKMIQDLVVKMDLSNSVNFLGVLDYANVYNRLSTWSVFILASNWEGFGLVIVEAMASGTPVVVSEVDAIPEIVTHKHTGLMFEKGNPNDLSSKVISLLKDESFSTQLASNAKIVVEENFSIETMICKLEKLYCRNH